VAQSLSAAWPKLGRSVSETFFTACKNELAYVGRRAMPQLHCFKNRAQEPILRTYEPMLRPCEPILRPCEVILKTYEPILKTYELILRTYEPFLWRTYELILKTYEPIQRPCELILKTYEPILKTFELILRTYELILRTYEPILRTYEPCCDCELQRQRCKNLLFLNVTALQIACHNAGVVVVNSEVERLFTITTPALC
jgi:hypothetical protein